MDRQTEDSEIYYFNFKTGESIWDHPCDKYYKNLFAEEKKKAQQKVLLLLLLILLLVLTSKLPIII